MNAKIVPVGRRTRRNSASQAAGSNGAWSHAATSLLNAFRHDISMFPVEYAPRLYGGSVQIRSTLWSGIRASSSRLSPCQRVATGSSDERSALSDVSRSGSGSITGEA